MMSSNRKPALGFTKLVSFVAMTKFKNIYGTGIGKKLRYYYRYSTFMSDSLDAELISLVNKLNKIQKEIGGGKLKDKNNLSIMEAGGKIDRFIDLKCQISDRVQIVKDTIEDIRKLERIPGANPKELISCQSKVSYK
jgi:hypothetical protein